MSRPQKVMFCCYGGNDLSGPNNWLKRILPRLVRIDPIVLIYRLSSLPCQTSQQLREQGVVVHEIDATDVSPCEGIRRVLDRIRAEAPAIVVADHVEPVFMAGYWLKAYGIRIVQVIRSDDWWHWRLADEFIGGRARCRVDGVVTVSSELASKLNRRYLLNVSHMTCPSSVPLPDLRAEWNGHDFKLIYMGRFEQSQKRILSLVHQLIRITRRRPSISAVLYGDGPERDKVCSWLMTEGGHRVSYGGVVPPSEVFERLREAQAFVLFSAYEGLSTALQEAMACGLPVIMKRISSGIQGVVEHLDNGFILDSDDGLDNAVEWLSGSKARWSRCSSEARDIAVRNFSMDRAAQRWTFFLERFQVREIDTDSDLPDLSDVEKVYAEHMVFREKVNCYQLDLMMIHGSERQSDLVARMKAIFREGRDSWEMRRYLFYRALDERLLETDERVMFASILIATAADHDQDFQFLYNVASLCELAEKKEDARAKFSALLTDKRAEDCYAGCYYHLGTIAVSAGDAGSARRHFKECLKLVPDHDAARKALQALSGYCGRAE